MNQNKPMTVKEAMDTIRSVCESANAPFQAHKVIQEALLLIETIVYPTNEIQEENGSSKVS